MTSTETTVTYALRPLFEAFLEDYYDDPQNTGTIVIRDANNRPWVVYYGENGDPFVISYPNESDTGYGIEPQDKYLGNLNLPTYPVRIVKES